MRMRPVVWLSAKALEEIESSADDLYPLESGGTLMGYWAKPGVAVVTNLIPAGPDAVHKRTSFLPDQEWQLREIARHYEASGRMDGYLGDWHSHPDADEARLSWSDKACLKRIIRTPRARVLTPLMMIGFGCPGEWTLEPKIAHLTRKLGLLDRLTIVDAELRVFESERR
jgi:integrative and conjugative element protein (TIGR02256 family)